MLLNVKLSQLGDEALIQEKLQRKIHAYQQPDNTPDVVLNFTADDFSFVGGQLALLGNPHGSGAIYDDHWYTYFITMYPESKLGKGDHHIIISRHDTSGCIDGSGWWLRYDYAQLGNPPNFAAIPEVLEIIKHEVQCLHQEILHQDMFTLSYQTWRVVALLRGLGFIHTRRADGDSFRSTNVVRNVYSGMSPSKDGSRLTDPDDVYDDDSPHYGRVYVSVYRFTDPTGHQNVIVWLSNSGSFDQLFFPIALGSYESWMQMMEKEDYHTWQIWIDSNRVNLS